MYPFNSVALGRSPKQPKENPLDDVRDDMQNEDIAMHFPEQISWELGQMCLTCLS